ncbi:ABC transporter ATP-binding protein [Inconstantimicrobium mannanitabidum]|uniref:ABC transporter ATP-binding protein n=1 Tax=Inconstantimicrobium mannanitabidum TaxID=1604901 RepID=A0ACB5R6N4_9CLOT|nr:ABC transporter ATP-binding protein [Clostridium sp. TW13]GKX64868.1 ABC transporter ATP-binding protein [Clostridium sp. TW13]
MSTIIKNIKFVWRMWKKEYGRGAAIFTFFALLFQVLLPVISVYLPKWIMHEFQMKIEDSKMILFVIGVMLAYLVLNIVSGYMQSKLSTDLFIMRIDQIPYVMEKSLDFPHDFMSSDEGKITIEKAKEAILSGNEIGPEGFFNNLTSIIRNIIVVVIFSILSAKLHPLIAIVILITSSIRLIKDYKNQKWESYIQDKEKSIFYSRFNTYQKCIDTKLGKDVRLYSIQEWFKNKFEKLRSQSFKIYSRRYNNQTSSSIIAVVMELIRDFVCYGFLLYEISEQRITVSEFVLYLGVISTISIYINQAYQSANDMMRNNIIIDNYRNYMEADIASEDSYPCHIPEADGYRIELQHVDFGYRDKKVIDDMNLIIEANQKVALVGANGAGKTTLIKLISGLYHPQRGKILINDVDISLVNPKEVYRVTSLVFQDVILFANSIAENISSSIPTKIDIEKLEKAIEKSGFAKDVQKLQKGYETNLTTFIDEGGINLSGGQQQKLMLAKALYKDAPMLILDEPTAALDPIAESELYEQYSDLTKNKTSIFISHRLSSTQFCDRVLFMAQGKIVQDGTHKQLMEVDGPYRTMFSIQAHYYQEEVKDNE